MICGHYPKSAELSEEAEFGVIFRDIVQNSSKWQIGTAIATGLGLLKKAKRDDKRRGFEITHHVGQGEKRHRRNMCIYLSSRTGYQHVVLARESEKGSLIERVFLLSGSIAGLDSEHVMPRAGKKYDVSPEYYMVVQRVNGVQQRKIGEVVAVAVKLPPEAIARFNTIVGVG